MSDELTPYRWEGDLPAGRFDEFLDSASTVLARAPVGIEVDLSAVRYLPSTMLGVLSRLSIDAQEQNKLVRVIVSKTGALAMRAVGLDQFLEIVADEGDGAETPAVP